MKINPDHPVTRELHDQWHKLLAIVLYKSALTTIDITMDDIDGMNKMYKGEPALVAHSKSDRITLSLTTQTEAEKKTRQ